MTYFKPNFDQLKATTAIDGDALISHQPKIVFLSATIPAVHFSMMATNLSCHVCGILWLIKYQPVAGRMLLTLTILDRSGIIHVISWNHNRAQFQGLVGKPVLIYQTLPSDHLACSFPSSSTTIHCKFRTARHNFG
jgi:hypothetical protein